MKEYNIADIVRLSIENYPGLYEITDYRNGVYYVTNDECSSEFSVRNANLILVCPLEMRYDI